MRARSRSSIGRYVGLGAISIALLASSALVGAPAQAMPVPGPDVFCLSPTPAKVPAARRILDTPEVSPATLARVERDLAATKSASDGTSAFSARAAALPVFKVRVQIHIIHGRHKGEHQIKPHGARRLFGILQAGYDGAQSTASQPMGVVFQLTRITVSKNDRWYHARPMSRADKQMKRKLHRGTAETLNIYLNRPTFAGGGLLLGYSRFPWQYRGHSKLDGVTINVASLPGGTARGYNLGDTVVHETGHWLGLLHPFQDGCTPFNDGVADTPAEAMPSFVCTERNTCDLPQQNPADPLGPWIDLPDPIHNFMDYSYDYCMNQFTPGQRQRVVNMYATYRHGR